MNPTILGVMGPGFLNQVPTLLGFWAEGTPLAAVCTSKRTLQDLRVPQKLTDQGLLRAPGLGHLLGFRV